MAATPSINTTTQDQDYDRLKELQQFDESKLGVKGLVDACITTIPRFFHHPPGNLPSKTKPVSPSHSIPLIDLSADRSSVVDQIRRASSTTGFFQISGHGVPQCVIDNLIAGIKSFNEQPGETRMKYYTREIHHGAAYSSNFDLYKSQAASWRDSLQVRLCPSPADWEYVPEECRVALREWDAEVVKVGERLMELLSEGLGLRKDKLKEISCLDARLAAAHYYPFCPEPDLTIGLKWHTDPGTLTVLVQNEVPGLEVKVGDDWVDVDPVPGAIIINIGDLLQIMSNDEYKSAEHRVLANPSRQARVAVAVFLNPGMREGLYGPLAELISPHKPALYRQFTFSEFMARFFSKELDGKTLKNYYRL